jgi:hypothetical protein
LPEVLLMLYQCKIALFRHNTYRSINTTIPGAKYIVLQYETGVYYVLRNICNLQRPHPDHIYQYSIFMLEKANFQVKYIQMHPYHHENVWVIQGKSVAIK